jgi:hypothetical protein
MSANTLLSSVDSTCPFASSILPVTLGVAGEKESDHGNLGVHRVRPSRMASASAIPSIRADRIGETGQSPTLRRASHWRIRS